MFNQWDKLLANENSGAGDMWTGLGTALMYMGQGGGPVRPRFDAQAASMFQNAMQAPRRASMFDQQRELSQLQMQKLRAETAGLEAQANQRSAWSDMLTPAPADATVPGEGPDVPPGMDLAGIDPKILALVGPKKGAEMIAAAKAKQGERGAYKTSDVAKIRGDYDKASKTFRDVADSYETIQSLPATAAGDVGLIFNIMKMFDPQSTVREGEFATAENAAGWGERARAAYNRALDGTRLTDDTRADFKRVASGIFGKYHKNQLRTESFYTDIAKRNNLDPRDVVMDYFGDLRSFAHTPNAAAEISAPAPTPTPKPASPPPPRVGTIKDGYRFLGGDPSDPSNWQKIGGTL